MSASNWIVPPGMEGEAGRKANLVDSAVVGIFNVGELKGANLRKAVMLIDRHPCYGAANA